MSTSSDTQWKQGVAFVFALACTAALAANQPQYLLFNRAPGQGMYQGQPESLGRGAFEEVLALFPNRPERAVRTGLTYVFSVFRTPPETTVAALRVFLDAAERTDTPIVVQIDTEHWWEARPDLWNWWDPARPGFDPANRENVEWTGWAPDQAIKIAWRNWGRQIRVLPPPNLASPRYLEACRAELRRLVPIVLDWQARLPEGKKNLLVGIKLGHETSIGVNAYHYTGGNALLDQSAQNDPVLRLEENDVLARGRAQLGFATVKTSGLRTSGNLTEVDLRDVCHRYLAMLCEEAAKLGVPRNQLFTHGAGWKNAELLYDVPVNPHACPGWSFYKHAADPAQDTGVQRNLARNEAPYWAACEYFLASHEAGAWKEALTRMLADPRCRYAGIFNWETLVAHPGIVKGVREFLESQPRHVTTIFRQPEVTDTKSVEACVIAEVHPQSERFYVRLGNFGKGVPLVPQVRDVRVWTGLHVPAGYQLCPQGAGDGTTVQVTGREIGIWIDSDHPRPAMGSLLPVAPAY